MSENNKNNTDSSTDKVLNSGAGKPADKSAAKSPNSGLFREKNLERLETPEKLNDYLRVTSPGIWLLLVTVIVLLAGVCIWGVFGTIQATTPAAIVTQDGESICLVPESALNGAVNNRIVTVDGEEKELRPDTLEPIVISEDTNVYTILAGQLNVGDIVFPIALAEPMEEDGVVSGTLVTETLSPAELFFNT